MAPRHSSVAPPGVPDAPPAVFDPALLRSLLGTQDGVVSRDQLRRLGARDHDVERLLRRRDLTVVRPGVYVDHTGPRTWHQRAWAAVLESWPAALAGRSALRAAAGPGWRGHRDDDPIDLVVDVSRTLVVRPGVRIRRMAGLDARVRWNTSPPRVREEEALIDVVVETRDAWDQIEQLAQACRARVTTPARLKAALAARLRVPRRRWLLAVLSDLADGTQSVLEHGYLHRVERAHGLPHAQRQLEETTPQGRVRRDVRYAPYDVDVELDGRLWHDDPAQRDRDLDRDLDSATVGRMTVRLGWGQVFARPCRTARALARVLQARGWTGSPTRCPRCADDADA